jgi:hypothetical protein
LPTLNSARQLLGENPTAPRFNQSIPLQGQILVNGRNPRVAEQHTFRRSILSRSTGTTLLMQPVFVSTAQIAPTLTSTLEGVGGGETAQKGGRAAPQ